MAIFFLTNIIILAPYNLSPRGSLINSDVSRFIRQNYSFQRSVSDDCDSIGESNSLLHPDHAWGYFIFLLFKIRIIF